MITTNQRWPLVLPFIQGLVGQEFLEEVFYFCILLYLWVMLRVFLFNKALVGQISWNEWYFVFTFVFVFAFSYICKWSRWYSFSIRRWLVRVRGKRGVFAHISFFSETILQRRSNWPLISHFQPTICNKQCWKLSSFLLLIPFTLKEECFCSITIQTIKYWDQIVAKSDP